MAFDTVKILEDTGGVVSGYPCDNEVYGEFYASTSASTPEPSILVLLGLSLSGLGFVRRRKRQS